MATTTSPTRRVRRRRTHAERTAETTTRIKAAAVEAIAELGFKRATATEITRRAGVSWGAAQHHFGDKTGILLAVLEDGAREFMDRVDAVPSDGVSLEKRVDGFVDAAWEHFRSDTFRSATEILTNLAGAPEEDGGLPDGAAMVELDRWMQTWKRLFGDVPLPPADAVAIQGYVVAVLSGLSSVHVLERGPKETRKRQLGFLKETLLRQLSAARRDGRK
ncbi:MAG: TetR/AcrR family transcriptional regulator [Candidatus Binatia bacterium]|nr:TetR/AcrR family transcriptional regulator [Candidatus Binatia bacterium]